MTGKLKSWGGLSFLAGVTMTTCWAALLRLPELRGPQVSAFLAYFLIAAVAYGLAVARLGSDRMPLSLIWGFANLFRLLLLFSAPDLSDDVYRYIWDGHLMNAGVNPYLFPVNAAQLDTYVTPLRPLVNHNWMASPYLPAAQSFFALVYRLAPESPKAFQAAAGLMDLLTGWLVMDLLGRLALPKERVLLYLWNPLVVVEFVHGAHLEALMITLVMGAFWFLACAQPGSPQQGRLRLRSVLALAGATLTKGVPLLLAPLFLRSWGWRRMGVYAAILAGACTLFALGAGWGLAGPLDGQGVFGATRIYLIHWNYNSGLYHWLEVAFSGYQTSGGVPIEIVGSGPIRLARLVMAVALSLTVCLAGWLAWRACGPQVSEATTRNLVLLRLATIPTGAYLLFSTTIHPWYVTLIVPFLPFLLLRPGEASLIDRYIWPWLYFACIVPISYTTYFNPSNPREFYLIRQVEYLPFFLLLAWAGWPAFNHGIRTLMGRGDPTLDSG